MRKLFLLLFALAALALTASAQSDCGNCWVVPGSGCNPSQDPICDPTMCQVCQYFVDCDNHDCAYHIGPLCQCGPTATNQKESHAKVLLATIRSRATKHSS